MLLRKYLLTVLLSTTLIFSQEIKVNKIEPPNWWAGMKYNKIQLMVYGENLKGITAKSNSSEIKITGIHTAESSSYCFIDLSIAKNIKPGTYKISLNNKGQELDISLPVMQRKDSNKFFKGFNQGDILYLIMPDRFANGDTRNDSIQGMIPGKPSSSPLGRHGGDIAGIINHLDYLKELGVTTIWNTPLIENNMSVSYHGYAATDLYKIDPRFGNNDLYFKLADEIHGRGMKLILDHVNNHIGINHPWMKNLPFKNWINGSAENHHITPHANTTFYDVHSSNTIWDSTNTGWFVDEMPDLNQENPFVAKYLIQNTLWWIESCGIDGIREDTYPYSNQKYLSEWAKIVMDEYAHFNIVGEVWIGDPAFRAPFQRGSKVKEGFDTNLPALMDFGLQEAIKKVFADGKSIREIYETLSKDYLYRDANNLVTFFDNHDIKRLIFSLNGDSSKIKLALTLLFTTRGIPQIFYGTEIGIVGGSEDGKIRENFPGGFPNSTHDAFSKEGRTASENNLFEFTKKLISLRKQYKALQTGKLIHFPPVNNMYFYLRILNDQKILVVINNNNEKQLLDISGKDFGKIKVITNLNTNEKLSLTSHHVNINANEAGIFLLE